MNIERQIIGSLLMQSSRIDDIHSLKPEMFSDPFLREIFGCYYHADGKEVNRLVIASCLRSDYWTDDKIDKLLVEIINEHDVSISDEFCADKIYKTYVARQLQEVINHNIINADTVDKFIDEITGTIDSLQGQDDSDIKSLSELTELASEYFNDNKKELYEFGFEPIDKAVGGLDKGDVIIIAARPAVGKSAFALQVIRGFGRKHLKVGYFNLEMSSKQVYERSIASASGIDMTRIRLAKNFLNDEKELFEKGNKTLKEETNVYVVSGTQSIKKIRAIQKKYKFDVICVDYMQLIEPKVSRGSRAAEVGDISRGLKAIARDFDIPVIAISQLNRDSDKLKDKEPHMSELRESGDIEQDASVIIMLWNSNEEDATEKTIKVEKSRNGFTDKAVVYFDGKHMKFKTDSSTDFESAENVDIPWGM